TGCIGPWRPPPGMAAGSGGSRDRCLRPARRRVRAAGHFDGRRWLEPAGGGGALITEALVAFGIPAVRPLSSPPDGATDPVGGCGVRPDGETPVPPVDRGP